MSQAKPESEAESRQLKSLGHSSQGNAGEALALEALETLQQQSNNFSPLEERLVVENNPSLLRAGSVLAEGLTEGVLARTQSALSPSQIGDTAGSAAEAYGMGYGLGALSKAGALGQKAATLTGLGMGVYWAGSEWLAGRPQDTFNAVAEAYHSGQNLDKNRQQIAISGGSLAFDTMLTLGAGGGGLKHGLKNPENWHLNMAESSHLNRPLSTEGTYARSFAGKDGGNSSVFDEIKAITKDGGSRGSGFSDIQQQMKQQAIKNDAQLLAGKEELLNHQKEHTALTAKEITLNNQLTRLAKERQEIDTSNQAQANLKKARESQEQIKELRQTIGPKEAELSRLENETEAARKLADATNSNTMEMTNERQLFNERLEKLQKARQEIQSLKEMTSDSAQERAQNRLGEAEKKLQEEQEKKPEKLAVIDRQVETIRQELTEIKSRQESLESEAARVIAQFKARQAQLEGNPELVEKAPTQEPKIKEQIKEQETAPASEIEVDKAAQAGEPQQAKSETVQSAPLDFRPEAAGENKSARTLERNASDLQAVVDGQKSQAGKAVRENELSREIQANAKLLQELEQGTSSRRSNQDPEVLKEEARQRIRQAKEELGESPQTSYTKAIKQVAEYARAVSKQLAQTGDSNLRGQIASDAVESIEALMNRLPNSYKGYTDKLPDLQDTGSGSPEMRLTLLKEHLEAKSRLLDQSRNQSLQEMAENHPVLSQIVQRQAEGSLPEDGTIILFDKEGRFINQPGTRSPHFMEVKRYNEGGIGADGAGLNRFQSQRDNIGGAVVLRPLYENGVPVQVPNKTTNGKPVFKKIVAEVLGDIPEEIQTDMNFLDILRRFAPNG